LQEFLFSTLRSKRENNVTLDASKKFSAIQISMYNMLINSSYNANCEKDASQFLALFLLFLALSKDLRLKNR